MMTAECSLNPKRFSSIKWKCSELDEIERQMSSETCSHTKLEDLVLTRALEGSTPFLMACREGKLASTQRIIESWGVDVNTTAVLRFVLFPPVKSLFISYEDDSRLSTNDGRNVSDNTEINWIERFGQRDIATVCD